MKRRIRFEILVVAMALVVACGGDELDVLGGVSEATFPDTGTAPAPLGTDAGATPSGSEDGEPDVEIVESCEDAGATEITVGQTVTGDIVPDDNRHYFCVVVPEDTPTFTVAASGFTGDVDLYVGYGALEVVQSGGLAYWSSLNSGAVDESILIEPGFYREGVLGGFVQADFVTPGAYYIEVSGFGGVESPYELQVTIP